MASENASAKKKIRELIKLGFIEPESIPSIELYMDQVTTFMDKYLSPNKRTDEDKTLTKTMINNYTKNDLLPPSNKKRYSKNHIIVLIYIYYLKNFISINDIQTMLAPLLNDYFDDDSAEYSMEDIYKTLYELEIHQYFNVENSIIKTSELANIDAFGDDEYLKKFSFLSLLGYDIFVKKKLMEKIIDEMRIEQEQKNARDSKKEAKKESKKESKRETKK